MKCIFCELPEIKKRIVIENDLAFAFPSNIPIVPGHFLVVSKRCVDKFTDLTEEEILAIFNLLKKLREALKKVFNAEGFNYAWNEDKVGGQNVPHLHIHILPRKEGDAGITEYEPRKFLYRPGSREKSSEAEIQEIVKVVKETLK